MLVGSQIRNRLLKAVSVFVHSADGSIAIVTEQAADLTSLVIVINVKILLASSTRRLTAANRAASMLLIQDGVVVRQTDPIVKPELPVLELFLVGQIVRALVSTNGIPVVPVPFLLLFRLRHLFGPSRDDGIESVDLVSVVDEPELGVVPVLLVHLRKFAIQLAEQICVMKLGPEACDLFVLGHLAKITS
jgi:hypothetical protein